MSEEGLSPAAPLVAAPSMRGAARSWGWQDEPFGVRRPRAAARCLRGAAVSQKR
jgi:hypothetical protein